MKGFIDAYIEALVTEIKSGASLIKSNESIHTIYIGGGTPSMLPISKFRKILDCVRENYDLAENIEITCEANPFLLTPEFLNELRHTGIERLSMGMQSAIASELQMLGRTHQLRDVIQSVDYARQAGFQNINLDLIFGIPNQTMESFRHSLETALTMHPDHLSIYSLTIEEGTPLERLIAKGEIPTPDDDLAAEMYAWVMTELEKIGFHQYEISNWARQENMRSRHNLQYWYNGYYLGFGAGAHSHYRQRRWANVNPIPVYIRKLENAESWQNDRSPAADSLIDLSTSDVIQEFMMMGLRLVKEGVAEEDFKTRFNKDLNAVYEKEIDQLLQDNLLEKVVHDGKHIIRLTIKGRMLGNQVFMQFIDG